MLAFLKSVFSEADGTGSFSRCGTAFVLACTAGWITAHMRAHGWTLPDFGSATMFVTSAAGVTYGVNKVVDAYKTVKNGQPPAGGQP